MSNKELKIQNSECRIKNRKTLNSELLTLNSKKGFTLIELIVAITIVGIISAIGLVTYSQSQIVARDAKRKQDLKAIQTSLQLYYQDNGRYPLTASGTNGGWVLSSSGSVPWLRDSTSPTPKHLVEKYMNPVPSDPVNTCTTGSPATSANCLTYGYWSAGRGCTTGSIVAGQVYVIAAQAENANDPEILSSTKNKKWCNNYEDLQGVGLFITQNNVFAVTNE